MVLWAVSPAKEENMVASKTMAFLSHHHLLAALYLRHRHEYWPALFAQLVQAYRDCPYHGDAEPVHIEAEPEPEFAQVTKGRISITRLKHLTFDLSPIVHATLPKEESRSRD